jgi:DnaJ like chaperone protein
MSAQGKIIGAVVGMFVLGPFGLLLGLWLGHKYDKKNQRKKVAANTNGRNEAVAAAVTALGAKIAKADGLVSEAEVRVFRRLFRVGGDDAARVGTLWREAARTPAGYEPYARHLAMLYAGRPTMLRSIFACLIEVAKADGVVSPAERWALEDIASIFGLGKDWPDTADVQGINVGGSETVIDDITGMFGNIFGDAVAEDSGLAFPGAPDDGSVKQKGGMIELLARPWVRNLVTVGVFITAYSAAMAWAPFDHLFLYSDSVLSAGVGAAAAFIARSLLSVPGSLSAKERAAAETAGVTPSEVDKTISETEDKVHEIRKAAIGLERGLQDRIDSICRLARDIGEGLRKDPGDVARSRPFLMHYLDATLDVLQQFSELRRRRGDSENFGEIFIKMEPLVADMETLFRQHYDRGLEDDALELDVSIDSLQRMIRSEAR